MVTVNNSDYYNNIPAGRDLNNLPNTSSADTTVGYQYDGLTAVSYTHLDVYKRQEQASQYLLQFQRRVLKQ